MEDNSLLMASATAWAAEERDCWGEGDDEGMFISCEVNEDDVDDEVEDDTEEEGRRREGRRT